MSVKVAIVGVGNAASILVQGLNFYGRGSNKQGLWHSSVGGLQVKDIEVVGAFDIDARKVGLDMSEAVFAQPNVARRHLNVGRTGVEVKPGLSLGDLPPHLTGQKPRVSKADQFTKALRDSGAEVLLNLISSGTDASTRAYASAALLAGCSIVNCTPALLLKDSELVGQFERLGLVVAGDDLMSQFGGTVFHKGLLSLMVGRGIKISKSYQLDVGGGSETFNTMDEVIKSAKRKVKTTSVASEVPYQFETVAGTTDFVDYMGNERTSYFWVEGSGFLNTDIGIDIYLRSSDGANAGNILLDVLRAIPAASKSHRAGAVDEICAYGFKSPPRPVHFDDARRVFDRVFVR
jgi:myo-inositol-1-phosphate synthase